MDRNSLGGERRGASGG